MNSKKQSSGKVDSIIHKISACFVALVMSTAVWAEAGVGQDRMTASCKEIVGSRNETAGSNKEAVENNKEAVGEKYSDCPDSPDCQMASLRPDSSETSKQPEMSKQLDSSTLYNNKVDSLSKKKAKRDWATWAPDPKRSMWLAIVLPGAGQIYNRKYWKLPIVYGGFLGCVYAWRWNNQMYRDYSQAYMDIMDDDPNTQSYNQFLHLGAQITDSNKERYQNLLLPQIPRPEHFLPDRRLCPLGHRRIRRRLPIAV